MTIKHFKELVYDAQMFKTNLESCGLGVAALNIVGDA